MAQKHKLNIYKFYLRKTNSRKQTKSLEVLNKIFFGESFDETSVQESILRMLVQYLDTFKRADNGNKAVKIAEKSSFSELEHRIDLMLDGGIIGLERTIFSEEGELKGKVEKNQVASTPFYCMMYTPTDMNYGFLLIQSYSDLSITSALYELITRFYRDNGITFRPVPHVPQEYRKKFLNNSTTKKITFLNSSPRKTAKNTLAEVLPVESNYRVRLVLDGLDETANESIKRVKEKDWRKTIAKLFDPDGSDLDSEDFKLQMTFETEDGKTSSATLLNDFQILPTVYLPEDLKDENDQPIFDKMKAYCLGLVNELLKEDKANFR